MWRAALFIILKSQKVETTDVYQLVNEQVKCGVLEYWHTIGILFSNEKK